MVPIYMAHMRRKREVAIEEVVFILKQCLVFLGSERLQLQEFP
jgi:hypothetical protein